MAGRIPQSFIDELLDRADIVEVINARVPLKKAGRDFVARCPFHDEKSPSFTVSPHKQFYYCFGCGASGTAIGFLMGHEHLSFPEAVEALASQYGLSVPRENEEAPSRDQDARRRHLESLFRLNQETAVFFARQLREAPGREGLTYLRQRGVDGQTIQRYGLGYAPPGGQALCQRFKLALLVEAGLVVSRDEGGGYDRFRHRIMFPIRSRRGQVVGFGGRALDERGPKYLNSPETPVFHKGREVYGLYELLQNVGRPARILVVEGYMDVIALAQEGIPYAVATLGTAVTAEHLKLLLRYSGSLVFSFDGDAAGRKAAWRALEVSLPLLHEGRKLAFLWLPEGEDPDSLVRKEGAEGFVQRLQQAEPLSGYFFRTLKEGLDLSRIEDRADLFKRAEPLLRKLPPGPFVDMMRVRLEELVGRVRVKPNSGNRRPLRRARLQQPRLEERLAILLLHYPELSERLPTSFRKIVSQGHSGELLAQLLPVLEEPDDRAIEERFQDNPYSEQIQKWLSQKEPLSLDKPVDELLDTAAAIEKKVRQQRLEQLARKADTGGLSNEEKEEMRQLMNPRAS